MALRGMGASRAVLGQAASVAEPYRDDFVRSRGEILRNFMKSMPRLSGGVRERLPKPISAAVDEAAEATLAHAAREGAPCGRHGRTAVY